jgi:hypothetical protein
MKRWFQRARMGGLLVVISLGLVYLSKRDWPALPDPLPEWAKAYPNLAGKAYCYETSYVFDSRELWRIKADPKLFDILVQELELEKHDSVTAVPPLFWHQPPFWWKPGRPGRFAITPTFDPAKREDGTYYILYYDKKTGHLYCWFQKNF